MFSYDEFTTRNLGFVSPAQQDRLRKSRIFIPGVGGMGGTALACLARSGIENFIIADLDTFEISNLNRQIFSNLDVIDKPKTLAAKEQILKINPAMNIQIYDEKWIDSLDEILKNVDLIVNGCDDHASTIRLLRKAKELGKTVIDAYGSTLASVYVVHPEDPRPEEYLKFPTVGKPFSQWTPEVMNGCKEREVFYVLVHSRTIKYAYLPYVEEMLAGKRKRISMAPMVWMTGILMSYEAIKFLLGEKSRVNYRGVFLNPYELTWEKPLSFFPALIKKISIVRWLRKFL